MNRKWSLPIVAIAGGALLWLGNTFGMKWALMALIGFGFGFTLSFSRFGIVFGWREMLTKRNSYYVRVHLLTIAIEILLFTAFLSFGHALFGNPMVGNVMAIGIPFIAGAFLFGIGMQLAGVCATGTLYCCGEGQPRFWLVLLCYGIGTLISNQFRPELESTFSSQVVLARDLTGNLWGGMLLNLALVALLFVLFRRSERRHRGEVTPLFGTGNLFWRDGRFTVLTGGVLIALLNSAVVALHGSAWTITGAVYDMALRGASLFGLFEGSPKLAQPLFLNPMVGMFWLGILGAMLARCISGGGHFAPIRLGNSLAAILGGLLMGMGAMYSACNLGGFFDGTASGSLHGWVWMLMALAGSLIGIRLRPRFGL
ncbi:YeeE/YedE family protein [Aeromonas sp. R6-2]|uniref:YeeE/YedE family protein n=1 Tax=unclassified Aeromonas TaxID=257493 RepID=UPI0034A4071D